MAESKIDKKHLNLKFEYRHIMHVATPGEVKRVGDKEYVITTDGELAEAVMEKFRLLDKKANSQHEPRGEPVKDKPPKAPIQYEPAKDGHSYRVEQAAGVGWFNVIAPDGSIHNSRALRKVDAESLVKELNVPKPPNRSYRVEQAAELGWFNVLDAEGGKCNEQTMRKEDAEIFAEKLMGV